MRNHLSIKRTFLSLSCCVFSVALCALDSIALGQAAAQLSDNLLQSRSPKEWGELAQKQGDARRGVNLFYRNNLACARCHLSNEPKQPPLGPNLGHAASAKANNAIDSGTPDKLTDEQVAESLLEPSKVIRKGYEAVAIRLRDGELISGILAERTPTNIKIRNASGELQTIEAEEIEATAESKQSLMPTGLVQQLPDEQAFLDLLKYLFEVRDGGPDRAAALPPDLALLAAQVPEYESRIDHAGFLQEWNRDSLARGQAIYQRVCANCHGTKDQIGSLPTALRFGEGRFKNGSDPFAMYQTLTHGYGFMPAQSWMVPSQKYDVIHYIRDTFMRDNPNVPAQSIDQTYLARLPKGDSRGPEPSNIEVWSAMDYGNMLTHCYEIPGDRLNIAYKGIAIRIDPGPGGITRGKQWMIFDTDTLRWAAAWQSPTSDPKQQFIDWRDIQFNGEHGIHPRIVGEVAFANATGPGWAHPDAIDQDSQSSDTQAFADTARVLGRDNRRYGPLPNAWGKFQGQFVCGSQTILVYSVGDAQILETPKLIAGANRSNKFARILNILPHTKRLELRVADLLAQEIASEHKLASPQIKLGKRQFGHLGDTGNCQWTIRDKMLTLSIPPSDAVEQIAVWCDPEGEGTSVEEVQNALPKAELELLGKTRNHPPRWSQILETKTQQTFAKNGFAVDTLVSPESNPWLAQLRFTGLDFFSDGSMAVCSWDGDVWHVRENPEQNSWTWKRMVSGLYQPLGLKILQDTVYLTCRDQLAALHDLDGDDEADFIECFNNDHQVTEHFHEFAMGLQTDDEGNFYYAKSGRHALKAVVPQHGTLLKVSADGSKTDILATGFRAANGVCLNRDGSFIVTDQEGFWNPKNRINWVTVDGPPKFYGNMFGYHDVTDSSDDAMVPPLCWITNAFDRSPAELLWVDSPTWGELQGGLLNLSYGYGKVYLVLHEQIAGKHQGGMIELPIPAFPTGVMRGRFSLGDHHLYLCGMFSWAGNATKPGGLYRIRKLPQPSHLPIAMKAYEGAIELEFAHPIDPASLDPSKVSLQQWGLKRSERYGSDHIDPHAVPVDRLSISNEGRTLRIESAALKPSWGMEIRYELRGVDEAPVSGVIHNTIHQFNSNQTK